MQSVLVVEEKRAILSERQTEQRKFWMDGLYDTQNADETLEIACKARPDIRLADAEMNGICRSIRRGQKNCRIGVSKMKEERSMETHFAVLLFWQRKGKNNVWMRRLIKMMQQEYKSIRIAAEQHDEKRIIAVCAYEAEWQLYKLSRQIAELLREAQKEKTEIDFSVGDEVEDRKVIFESFQSAENKMRQNGDVSKSKNNSANRRIVLDCMVYIQENYGNAELTLEMLAESVYLSPNYLSGLFRRETGMTISQYIMNVRISHAKKLLKNRSLKIYDVAYRSGYKDANYFAKVFKKIVGVSPMEYRAIHCI